jgi:hypothetical protein
MTVGDQGSNGYGFPGTLDVGAHPVTVLGPPGTPLVTSVLISGGTLMGSPELKVAPAVGFIYGTGKVTGTVRLGEKPVPAAGLFGIDDANKLEFSGLVTGKADDYAFVNFTGAARLSFSPAFSIVRGVGFADTVFEIGGNDPGEKVYDPGTDADKGVTGDYTQYLVAGNKVGQGGPPLATFFDKPSLVQSAGFEWSQLAAGELRLITTGEARLKYFGGTPPKWRVDNFDKGAITYGATFESDLSKAMAAIQLAPGLSWGPVNMNPDMLVLTIVPEPGTLVLKQAKPHGVFAFVLDG